MNRTRLLMVLCAALLGVSLGAFFALDAVEPADAATLKTESGAIAARQTFETDGDAVTRLLSAVQIENALERSARTFDAVGALGSTEIAGLMERVKSFPYDLRTSLENVLFRRWLLVDSEAAGRWVEPDVLDMLIRQDRPDFGGKAVVGEWVRAAPDAALAFAVAHPSARHSAYVATSAARRLARDEPLEAVRILAALPAGHVRDGALAGILTKSANTDPARMFGLLSSIDDPEKRGWTALSILTEWAEKEGAVPVSAVNSLLPQLPEDRAVQLAADVASKAGKSAAPWSLTLAGTVRDRATEVVYGKWLESDALGALQWIDREGLGNNPLAAGWRRSIGKFDPAAVRDQLLKMPDSPVRTAFITSAIGSFPDADAIRLINTLPESYQSDAASYLAYSRMKNSEGSPASMVSWISTLPEGAARAGAAARMGREFAERQFPELMLVAVRDINDEEKRAQNAAIAAPRHPFTTPRFSIAQRLCGKRCPADCSERPSTSGSTGHDHHRPRRAARIARVDIPLNPRPRGGESVP